MTEESNETETERLDQRRRAYQTVFGGERGKEVLQDLVIFCGSKRSSFSSDALEMAFREGRREVWLRIEQHLNLTDDDIWNLFQREKETNE